MSTTKRLTKKELAARWGKTTRTVERDVRKFGLLPADFIGIQPVFDEKSVERMEERRRLARMKQLNYPGHD
jgi:hypothetical protein